MCQSNRVCVGLRERERERDWFSNSIDCWLLSKQICNWLSDVIVGGNRPLQEKCNLYFGYQCVFVCVLCLCVCTCFGTSESLRLQLALQKVLYCSQGCWVWESSSSQVQCVIRSSQIVFHVHICWPLIVNVLSSQAISLSPAALNQVLKSIHTLFQLSHILGFKEKKIAIVEHWWLVRSSLFINTNKYIDCNCDK